MIRCICQQSGGFSHDIDPSPTPAPTPTPVPTLGSLAVAPRALGFKSAGTDTSVNKTLAIKNSAKKGELIGSVETAAAPFTVTSGSGAFSLAPGSSEAVTVQFAPTAPGAAAAALVITSNDSKHTSVSVKLSGTGVGGTLSVPASLAFLKLKPGAQHPCQTDADA